MLIQQNQTAVQQEDQIAENLLEGYRAYKAEREAQDGDLAAKGIALYHEKMRHKNKCYEKHLCDTTASSLMPYIEAIVDSFEYDTSPIYDDHIDRETIHLMTDCAYETIVRKIPRLNLDASFDGCFSSPSVLRSLIRQLIIMELYNNRRPNYKPKPQPPMYRQDQPENNAGTNAAHLIYSPWFY